MRWLCAARVFKVGPHFRKNLHQEKIMVQRGRHPVQPLGYVNFTSYFFNLLDRETQLGGTYPYRYSPKHATVISCITPCYRCWFVPVTIKLLLIKVVSFSVPDRVKAPYLAYVVLW